MDSVDGKVVKVTNKVLPCTLDAATKNLIELILSNDMFKEAMECMNLGGCVSSHHPFLCKQVHPVGLSSVCINKYLVGNKPVRLFAPVAVNGLQV